MTMEVRLPSDPMHKVTVDSTVDERLHVSEFRPWMATKLILLKK